jgi:hypothetical protein
MNARSLVRREVVENDVNVELGGDGRIDRREELNELDASVAAFSGGER